MKLKLLIGAILCTTILAFAEKDPVLMTINGKDIHLSEFTYLYNKNKQQQVQNETLDQYVDRFVTYKLKVADAEAEKIDTLKSFQNEFNGYKQDLVKPFLIDTTVNERLEKEAYARMLENVDVDHIMIPLGRNQAENDKYLAQLDSIRTCILNGENFEALVDSFSVDPTKGRNHGHYGYIASGNFPYNWEYIAYTTPIGQICKPFRTDFGNHLIRVNGKRPDPGQVEVEHILLLFPRKKTPLTDEDKAAVKVRIDSIYTVLKNGADFEATAKALSQDPGTATKGGKLPWFGPNRMVPEFEKVSFALNDGEISEPFETSYGYHIVKKLGHKDVASFEECRKQIQQRMQQDERSTMARDAKVEELMKYYNYKNNDKAFRSYLTKEIEKNGKYDSTFVAKLAKSNFVIYTYGKEKVKASVLVKRLNPKAKMNNDAAVGYIASQVEPYAKNDIMQHYVDNIIDDNADYRNLIHEYRDGMLLFEVSNKKVWEGASKDTTGLKNYFEANRSKYNWEKPHFKGIILSAQNDSICQEVKKTIPTLGADTLTTALHNKFGSKIKMERMTVAQGENKTADVVVFGQPKIADKNNKYPVAFVLTGGVINQPEEVADVKGLVTSDYQEVLEKQWIKDLKKKYPVKINYSVLKLVK